MKKFISALLVVMMLVSMLPATALFANAAAGDWTLVTSVSDLAAGDQVVIVAKDANFALSTTQNSNNRGQAAVTKSGSNVTINSSVQVLELKDGKSAGTFAFYTGSGYLYAASSSKNYLKTETNLSANSSWNITIAEDGNATVKSAGSYTKNWLRHNSPSSIFSCYSSGQNDICLYKLEVGTGEVTCDHVGYETYLGDDAVAASCTAPGQTASVYCANCDGKVSGPEAIPATGHAFVDGVCKCGLEAFAPGRYYIATKRSSGNYWYMTNDLGTANTSRFTAEDSGLAELPAQIASTDVEVNKVFAVVLNEDSTFTIYAEGVEENNYVGWTSGNSAVLVEESKALKLSIQESAKVEGAYNVYNIEAGRYLSLNSAAGADYFAFYTGTQAQDLVLISVAAGACLHENTEIQGAVAPTCTTVGATGTTVCLDCGETIKESEELPVSHEGFGTYTEDYIAPTCTEPGETGITYCENCDEVVAESEEIPALGHSYVDGTCSTCGDKLQAGTVMEATITFDDKTTKRTVYTTEQQVWTENSVVVTNDKAGSTTNIGDYQNPARFYKGSTVTVAFHSNMTQIVFDCNSTDYASALAASITEGAMVTTNSDKVTVVLNTPAASFTTGGMSAQVRVDSIAVTYEVAADACLHEETEVQGYVAPTCTTEGATGNTVCTECGEVLIESAVLPVIDHAYDATGTCTSCGATTPVATLMTELPKTNDVVIIYNVSGFAMTGAASGSKIGAVAAAPADGKLVVTEDMGQVVVRALGNDQYAFVVGEKFLTSGATGNSLSFADELTECGKWTFEEEGTTAGTYYIRNVGANYDGNYNQALEYYSGFTTYGIKTTDAYKMQMFFVKAIVCEHPSSTQQDDAVAATCVTNGYTASTTCDICGAVTVEPEIIPATDIHIYENDSCTMCQRVNPNSSLVAGLMTSAPLAGDEVIIYSSGYLMTATVNNKKLAGVAVDAPVDGKIPYNADVLVMTVSIDAAGYYMFQNAEGAYLTSGETGNLLTFAAELTDYAKWAIQSADSGESWYIVNKSATYNEIGQALEYYGGFTSYTIDFSKDAFKMQLFNVNMMALTEDVDGLTYEGKLYLDLNGHKATNVVADELVVWDSSATATTAGTGSLTTECAVAVDNTVDGVRYIALKGDDGAYTFHVLELKLTAVTLRTNKAGIYYKAEMNCDEVLKAAIESHGIAVSIMGMPTADFENEENTAATKILGAPESVFTSGSITNIFRSNLSAEKNAARGEMAIYANPYIKLADGTVLMGNNNAQKSLKDVMDYLNENYASLGATEQENVKAFYTTWAEDMASWNLENLAAAIVPTTPEEEQA